MKVCHSKMNGGGCSVIRCVHEVFMSINWCNEFRMVVRRLARYRGDATESEDCVDREDEHGRVTRLRHCKDTRGREGYVGNSGWRSQKKKMGNKHGHENKRKRGQSHENTNVSLDIGLLS